MSAELLILGNGLAAIALIVWAFASLINGSAIATGASFRNMLLPGLASIRSSSTLARDQLSDVTMICAVVAALLGGLATGSVLLMMIGLVLFVGRPQLGRIMKEENKLLAVAGSFSIDLAIGLYVPVVLAQVLLANYAFALVFSLVVLALSWPPGGAGVRRGAWQPTWS